MDEAARSDYRSSSRAGADLSSSWDRYVVQLLQPFVENLHNKCSHEHFCYVGGHRYECGDDCECICGLPMNGYDHSDCPVELRPCPESESHQEQPMSEEEGPVEIKFPADWRHAAPHCECGCSYIDSDEVVGWCLHCDHKYVKYTPELQDRHFAYHCPDQPEELKEVARARLARRRRKLSTP